MPEQMSDDVQHTAVPREGAERVAQSLTLYCRGSDGYGGECWERDGCLRYLALVDVDETKARVVNTLRRSMQARYSPCLERVE